MLYSIVIQQISICFLGEKNVSYNQFVEDAKQMRKRYLENLLVALVVVLFGINGLQAIERSSYNQRNDNSDFIEIQIGTGTAGNSSSGAPTPYGTYYKSFRQQYLIRASEMSALGAGVGNIQSISFFVTNLNNCSPMPNYRIRMKHSEQNVLVANFEEGDYQVVFQEASFMPTAGWNEHTLNSDFNWDGQSNLLIDIVSDIIDGTHTQNASVQFSNSGFNSSLRFHSDDQAGDTATHGTVTAYRSNIRLKLHELNIRDLAALSVSGERVLVADVATNHSVTVKNFSNVPESNYQIKLMQEGGVELGSINGTLIQPMEEISFTIPWTPTSAGTYEVYGKVILANDEIPENDESPGLPVRVIESGLSMIQHGYGTNITDVNSSSTPYGNRSASFRQQYLFTAAELSTSGASFGSINYLAFNLAQLGQSGTMYNYRIRLKHTQRTDLYDRYFEEGDYLQVYQVPTLAPHTGWNIHAFDTPFVYNGTDNLIVEIITDFVEDNNHADATVFYTPTSSTTCLRAGSQAGNAIDLSPTSRSTHRPNIRFYMNVGAMGTLSGNISEDGFAVPNALVRLGDTIHHTFSDQNGDYLMEALPIGSHQLSISKYGYESVFHEVVIPNGGVVVQDVEMEGIAEFGSDLQNWSFGQVIESGYLVKTVSIGNIGGDELTIESIQISGSEDFTLQNLPPLPSRLRTEEVVSFDVVFAPSSLGNLSATILIEDNIADRATYEIAVEGIGISHTALTVGDGSEFSNVPIDVFYNTSLFETIYTPEELQHFNGLITGLKFYYVFQSSNIFNKPVKVWMGTTALDNLLDGWIRPSELDLVFDGEVSFVTGSGTLEIIFSEPYEYTSGENLVMMVFREYDPVTYTFYEQFYAQRRDTPSSINIVSLDIVSEPINPHTAGYAARHVSGIFPKTTFLMELQENLEYTISGVFNTHSWDLNDVEITATDVAQDAISYDAQTGEYSITVPAGWGGSVIPSKEGYIIEPSSRTYQNLLADVAQQNYIIKRNMDPDSPIIRYPAQNQVFQWEEPGSITITWRAQGIVPEYYEISFNGGDWQNYSNNTEYYTPLLESGEYSFMVRGVITSPQAKSAFGLKANTQEKSGMRGTGEPAIVNFSVVITSEEEVGTLAGLVTHSSHHAPLQGALIYVSEEYQTQSDESGAYSLELPVGIYTVAVSHEEYNTQSIEGVEIAASETTSLNVNLVPISNENIVEVVKTELRGNYPNPFKGSTVIDLSVKAKDQGKLSIFNVRGQKVFERQVGEGSHLITWDGLDFGGNRCGSGIYYYRLETASSVHHKKMLIIK